MAEKIKGMEPVSANEVGRALADIINPVLADAQKRGKGKAEVELNIKQTTSGGDQVRKDLKKTQKALDEVAKARKALSKSLEKKSGFDRIISFASPDQIKERILGSLSAYNDLRFKYPKQNKKDAPKSQMSAVVTDIWNQINSYQAVMGNSKTALSDLSAYVQEQIKDDTDIKEKDLFDTFLRENSNTVRSTVAQYIEDYKNALLVGIKDGEKTLVKYVKNAAEKINSDKAGKKNFVPIDIDRLEKDYLDFDTVFEDEEVIKELQKNLQGRDAGKWTNKIIQDAVTARKNRIEQLKKYFISAEEAEKKIVSLIKLQKDQSEIAEELTAKFDAEDISQKEIDEINNQLSSIDETINQLLSNKFKYIAAQLAMGNNKILELDKATDESNDYSYSYYLKQNFKDIGELRDSIIHDIFDISQLKSSISGNQLSLSVKENAFLMDEADLALQKLRAEFIKGAIPDIDSFVKIIQKEYTTEFEKTWNIDKNGKFGPIHGGEANEVFGNFNETANLQSNWHTHSTTPVPSAITRKKEGDWFTWLNKAITSNETFGQKNVIPYFGIRGKDYSVIVDFSDIKPKDKAGLYDDFKKFEYPEGDWRKDWMGVLETQKDIFRKRGYDPEKIIQVFKNSELDAMTNESIQQTLDLSKALIQARQDALNAVQVTTKAIKEQKAEAKPSTPNPSTQRHSPSLPSKPQQTPAPQIKQEAEARQENAEAAREEAKAVEESNEKKFVPYSKKDVLEVVNSKKEKARKFPQHIFKKYGVQESDSLEETLASYISAMEDYKEERDEENARLIKLVTTSYNQIMQKQFESGKGEVPKDFPFKDRKFAEGAVTYLNYQNAEKYFNEAIENLKQQIEAAKQAIPTPEEVQEEVNAVVSDEISTVSNPPAPRDIMGPFRALTKEMIESRLEQMDSMFEDPNKIIEYYHLPTNKKNKTYKEVWQRALKKVTNYFDYDKEIEKLIEDSKDSTKEYGGYEAASWVMDPSLLTERLQFLKDELVRIKYLEEVVSGFASEYKALNLSEITSLIDEHSISIPDPDELFASYGVTSENRSIETLLEAEQKFIEERAEQQAEIENKLVELYNTLAKEGENPFEDARFLQLAGDYQFFQKGADLFIEEIEHVREEIQRDAEMSRERIRNAIDERLRDIVVDEEQPSIERGELLELAEQRKQATENIAIEQKAEAEKLESNSAVINQERQATDGLRNSTNAATEASKQHTASMAQEAAQVENLKNAAQQAADSMKGLNNAKQESAFSGGNGAVPPTGGGGSTPPPTSPPPTNGSSGNGPNGPNGPSNEDLEKLLATINSITNELRELQRLEQEASTNPQPFTDYAFEIEKAKEQLRLYKLELEDLLQTKFHSSSNDLSDINFLNQFSYSAKQNSAFQSGLGDMQKAGSDLGITYMQQAKAVFTQYIEEFQRYLSMMEGNTTGNFDASLEEQRQTVLRLQNAYQSLYSEMQKMSSSGMAKIDFATFENGMQSLFDTANKLESTDSKEKIIDSYIEKIASLREQFRNMGDSAPTGFISSLDLMKSELQSLKEQIQQGTITWNEFHKAMMSGGYSTDLGKMDSFLNIQPIIDQFEGVANDRIPEFTKELESLKQKFAELMSTTDPKRIKELSNEMLGLVKQLTDLDKIIVHDTGKGTLFDVGQIKSIDDMRQKMDAFAQSAKLGSLQSQKLSTDGKTLTRIYQDASGRVYELKGRIDEETQAWRANLQTKSNVNNFLKGFSSSFVGLAKNLTMFVSVGRLAMKVRQEFSKGLNTFKEYDKTLTQISYTMNLTKSELSDLGQSAVNMAKDLSMSLSNAEAVFQIYANMNTTAEEIQKTAKPTVILSNLSGVDASKAADEVQGILQQFNMLKDSEEDVADVSMHIVDVLDNISANVAMDYAKGIDVITQAVTATGQVAYDAGMSFEQLAAISAKVAERTREDGSTIGNALKTIITRTSKVGKMPQYSDEVDNETLSKASESLSAVGIKVYEANGEMRSMIDILSDLREKWDGLSDAQKSNIAFNIAATRQTSKFKNILEAWNDAMSLAKEATTAQGNALANQEKFQESFAGKTQEIRTQMDAFWINFFNSDAVDNILDFVINLTEAFNGLADAISPVGALLTTVFGGIVVKSISSGLYQGIIGAFGASGLKKAIIKAFASFKFNSLLKQGMDDGTIEQTMKNRFSSLGLANYTKATLQAELAGKSLLKTLGLTALGIAAVTAGVYLGVKAYQRFGMSTDLIIKRNNKLIESQKKIAKQHQEVIDENNKNADSLQNLLEKYEEAEIGSQDYYNIRAQIAEQFPNLITGYDSEGRAIIANTELIRQQIEAYRNLSVAEQEAMREEAGENIDKAINGEKTGFWMFGTGDNGVKTLIAQRNKDIASLKELDDTEEKWQKDHDRLIREMNDTTLSMRDRTRAREEYEMLGPSPKEANDLLREGYQSSIKEANTQLSTLHSYFKSQYALIAGDLSDLSTDQISAMDQLEQLMSRYFENGSDFSDAADSIKHMGDMQAKNLSDLISSLLTPDLSNINVQEYKEVMEERLQSVYSLLQKYMNADDYAELVYQMDINGGAERIEQQIESIVSNVNYQNIAQKLGINLEEVLNGLNVKELNIFDPDAFFSEQVQRQIYSKWGNVIKNLNNVTLLSLQDIDWNSILASAGSYANIADIANQIISTGILGDPEKITIPIQAAIDKMAEWGWIVDDTAEGIKNQFDLIQSSISESLSNLSKSYDIYNTAITESNKNGYLSQETYSELIARNAEYADAITETASGLTLDTKKMRNLNREEKKGIQKKLTKERIDLANQYDKNTKKIEEYSKELVKAQTEERKNELTNFINNLLDSNSAIESNIGSLRDLQNQLNATGTAWDEWQKAQNSGNPSDRYFEAGKGFDAWEELRKKGLTGTDDYQSFVRLLTGLENEETVTSKETAKFMEYLNKRYFTEDRSGLQNLYDDIEAVYKENGLESLILENGELDITNTKMIAKLLSEKYQKKYGKNSGLTAEALEILLGAGSDFNMGDPLSDGTYSDNIEKLKENLEQLQELQAKEDPNSKEWQEWQEIINEVNNELREMEILQNTVMDQDKMTDLLGKANQFGYRDPTTGEQKTLSAKLVYKDVEEATEDLVQFEEARRQLLEKKELNGGILSEEDQASLDAISAILSYILGQKQQFEQPWVMSVDTSQLDAKTGAFISKLKEYYKTVELIQQLKEQGNLGTTEGQAELEKSKQLLEEIRQLDKESGGQLSASIGLELNEGNIPDQLKSIFGFKDGEAVNGKLTVVIDEDAFNLSHTPVDDWITKVESENVGITIVFKDAQGNDITSLVLGQHSIINRGGVGAGGIFGLPPKANSNSNPGSNNNSYNNQNTTTAEIPLLEKSVSLSEKSKRHQKNYQQQQQQQYDDEIYNAALRVYEAAEDATKRGLGEVAQKDLQDWLQILEEGDGGTEKASESVKQKIRELFLGLDVDDPNAIANPVKETEKAADALAKATNNLSKEQDTNNEKQKEYNKELEKTINLSNERDDIGTQSRGDTTQIITDPYVGPMSEPEPEPIGYGHGAKIKVDVEAEAEEGSGKEAVEEIKKEVDSSPTVEVKPEFDYSSLSGNEQQLYDEAKEFVEYGEESFKVWYNQHLEEIRNASTELQNAINELLNGGSEGSNGQTAEVEVGVTVPDNAAEQLSGDIGTVDVETQFKSPTVPTNEIDSGSTYTLDTSDAEKGLDNIVEGAEDVETAIGNASKKQLGDVGTPITRQQLDDTITKLTSVGNTTDEVSTHNIGDLGAIAASSYMSTLDSDIKNVGTDFDSLNRTATLTLNIKTNGSVPEGGTISSTGGTGNYKGTASFAHGTWSFGQAFAKGNIGAPRSEEALVGELGPEMRVRGSRWELLGQNGPEFRDIRKNDIVFDADQTADLLSRGKTDRRGKAFAHGTSGTAYGRFKRNPDDAGGSSSNSGSSGSKGNSGNTGNNNGNNNTEKETKSALDTLKEGWGRIIDWVAVKLEDYSRRVDKLMSKAERTWTKLEVRDKYYDRAIRKIDASIKITSKGADRYSRRAEGVLRQGKNAIGTKSSDARKAQKEIDEAVALIKAGGNVKHIKTYSEDAKTVIDEYQKWYDLARDTQDKLDELEDQRHELEKSRIELLTNRFDSKINHISSKAERVQSQISALESMDMFADSKQYEQINKYNQQQINLYNQQIAAFEKGQSKVAKYSEDWYEYQDSIDSARASIDDLTTSMIENAMSAAQLHTQLAQLKNEKLDKQNDILDAKIERDQLGIIDRRGITAKGLNVRSYVYQKNANTGQKVANLRTANNSNATNVRNATNNLANAKQTKEYSALMKQIVSAANGTDEIPSNLVSKIFSALQADPSNTTLQSFYRKVLDYNAAIKAYVQGQYDYEMAQIQAKADAQANAEAMKSNRQARRDARNEKAENLYNVTANLFENDNGTNFGYGQSKRDAEATKIGLNNKADDKYVKEVLSDLRSTTNKNNSAITKELNKKGSVNKKGYKQALKNAQTAMSSGKLISDGDINVIQKYNPELAAQLLMYNFQVGDAEEAKLEQATNYAANNARLNELTNEKYEKRKSIADNRIERNDAYIENGTSDTERNKYLSKNNHQIDNKLKENYDRTEEFLDQRDTAAKRVNRQIKKTDLESMPKHYRQAVDHALKDIKNGYSIGDEFLEIIADGYQKGYISYTLYKSFIDYKEANEWYRQSKYAQELEAQTLKKQKAQNSVKMLQNIATEHERRRATRTRGRAGENIRGITGYNRNGTNATAANRSFAQTMGHYTNVADIEDDIMTATENYADAYQEYQKLKDKFAEQYKAGAFEEGSDEWHEQLDIIENARQNMDGFVQSIEELKVEMRDLEWQKFDDMMASIKRLNAEYEYFQGLIANETFFDEDNRGHITRYGMAAGLLHKEAYQTDLSEALKYRDELIELNAQIEAGIKNGGLDGTSKDVIERQRQLTDAIRESVNAAESEKQALIDLVRQGYEAQLSALNKSISKYKDLKDAEKEAYDYQKDITEQTKNITNLQKQLAAFEGNTSEESIATVQKLQADLEQAESDLQDKQYEKYLSDAQDMLDDLSNNFQEWIEYYMKDRDQVFDDMLEELRGISSHLGDNLGTLYRNSKDTMDLLKGVETNYFGDKSNETLQTLSNDVKIGLMDIKNDKTNLNDKVVSGIEEGFEKVVNKQEWRESTEKQINKKGYASGSKKILSDQLAWTQENGTEAIYRKSDGAILTPLGAGDMVFTHAMTEQLWELANMNIPNMIKDSFAQPVVQNQQDVVMSPNTNIQMNITLPNVKNYDEFKQAMLNDKQFQNGIQAMTLGAAMGHNSLSKLKYS